MNLWVAVVVLFFRLGGSEVPLNGTGSSLSYPLYNQWIYFYQIYDDQISYTSKSSELGALALSSTKTFHFAGIDYYINNTCFNYFPTLTVSIAVVYHLPGVDEVIVLDRPVLANIFAGLVTVWNDPQILSLQTPSLQTKLSSCNRTILPVVREDNSGTTEIFTAALSSFSSTWQQQFGQFSTWPKSPQLSNHQYVKGNIGIFTRTLETAYSIGYIPYPYIKQESTAQYAKIINKRSQAVSPSEQFLSSHLSEYHSNDTTWWQKEESMVDLDVDGAYPIIGWSYLVVNHWWCLEGDVCEVLYRFYSFLHFTYTNEFAQRRLMDLGYYPIDGDLKEKMLEKITMEECREGRKVFTWHIDEVYSSSNQYTIIIITIIKLAFDVILLAVFLYQSITNSFVQVFILYAIIMTLGIVTMETSIFFWILSPKHDSICFARLWLSFTGIMIVMAGNFARASQIQLLMAMQQGKIWIQPHFALLLLRDILICLGLQVLLLLLWTVISDTAWVSILKTTNAVTLEGEYRCSSSNIIFPIIQIVLYFCVNFYGIFTIYKVWSFSSTINQSKWILVSTYNFILFLILYIPLWLYDEREISIRTITIIGIFLLALQSQVTFFVPSFMKETAKSDTTIQLSNKIDKNELTQLDLSDKSTVDYALN